MCIWTLQIQHDIIKKEYNKKNKQPCKMQMVKKKLKIL